MSNQKDKANTKTHVELPPIPDKIYFTIGEVGRLCKLKPHVLRYWEQEFGQLAPSKRRGNRRYYQHKDVVLIRRIRALLYDQGYTIEGARHQLMGGISKDIPSKAVYNAVQTAIVDLEKVVVDLAG
jgi:DNA-binding transcriptional MerR regulator